MSGSAPSSPAVQHLVPAHMRATASASFLLINNLIGIGGGTFFLGALSDALTRSYGDEALRYAMLASLGFYLLAALLMWLASKPLRQDWVESIRLNHDKSVFAAIARDHRTAVSIGMSV